MYCRKDDEKNVGLVITVLVATGHCYSGHTAMVKWCGLVCRGEACPLPCPWPCLCSCDGLELFL